MARPNASRTRRSWCTRSSDNQARAARRRRRAARAAVATRRAPRFSSPSSRTSSVRLSVEAERRFVGCKKRAACACKSIDRTVACKSRATRRGVKSPERCFRKSSTRRTNPWEWERRARSPRRFRRKAKRVESSVRVGKIFVRSPRKPARS